MNKSQKAVKRLAASGFFATAAMLLFLGALGAQKLYAQDAAADGGAPIENVEVSSGQGLGFIGAGVAFGLAALGAGIAVANVGAAAMGALGERPELASQALIFVALGEGIVIFGFIIAFLIMQNLG